MPCQPPAGTLPGTLAALALSGSGAKACFPPSGQVITAGQLSQAADRVGPAALAAGVIPGELVGVLTGATPDFLTTIFGLWRAGAAVTVLPVGEGLENSAAAAARAAAIVKQAGLRHVVADQDNQAGAQRLAGLIPGLAVLPAGRLASAGISRADLPGPDPGQLAVVQFTSGSTSKPRGVMLTHRAVLAGLQASPDDVLMQWVPLFHDMGLMGMLSVLLAGAQVHVFSPLFFLRRTAALMEYFSHHRGTILTGPNFSYDYLLDMVPPERLAALDLSSWRLAFNGAEPVAAATVERFAADLAPCGVSPAVMYPVYGMAEATLAVSFPRPGTPPHTVSVDKNTLAPGAMVAPVPESSPHAKRVVSVGYPVHRLSARIAEGGEPGRFGEIQIRGDAITSGYHRNRAASGELFADDCWLRTGDLGFFLGGELFVVGRRKEMIIVHGQNFFPEDVEALARDIPGIFRKRCIAVRLADGDTEQMTVIAESRASGAESAALGKKIAARLATELNLNQVKVHVVQPHWLTRTTSGKWQRTLSAKRITHPERH
jgi:fatty-acyl-CoA synthase